MNIIFRLTLELAICSLFCLYILQCFKQNDATGVSQRAKFTLNSKDERYGESYGEAFLAGKFIQRINNFKSVISTLWMQMSSPWRCRERTASESQGTVLDNDKPQLSLG